jgi:hypothetical protein
MVAAGSEKLLEEAAQVRVAAVPGHAFLKFLVGKVLDQLREDRAASSEGCAHLRLVSRGLQFSGAAFA